MSPEKVLKEIIYPSIEKANEIMPNFRLAEISANASLYGTPDAILDSLNLVSFVFLIENEIEARLRKKITIAVEDIINSDDPPFSSLTNLSIFLERKIKDCQ